MKVVVSTWFYSSPTGERIDYPQLGENSDEWSFKKCYWDCIVSFFYSAHHFCVNTEEIQYELVFFTNADLPLEYDFSLQDFFNKLGVKVVNFVPKHLPMDERFVRFNSQFVMVDILDAASQTVSVDDVFLIFDGDCVFVKEISISKLMELKSIGVQFIKNSWPSDAVSNGISNKLFNDTCKALTFDGLSDIEYWAGGEYFGLSGICLSLFNKQASKLYEDNLLMENPLLTEEQLFTLLFSMINDGKFSEASSIIDRVWTQPNYRTTNYQKHSELSVLHLPAEKRSGFNKYASMIGTAEIGDLELSYIGVKNIFSLD